MTMNRIVLSRCIVLWNCLFTSRSFGNAGIGSGFHENLLSGFGRRQSRCQITNPSVQPESLILRFNQSHEESFMNIQALFGLSVFMSFVAFGLVTQLYIWPRLQITGARPSAHSIGAAKADRIDP